jgi:hypothetical protein
MRNKYRDLYLLLFWFAPILVNISSSRFTVFNLEYMIVYLMFLFILLGGMFTLTCLHSSKLSIHALIIIFTLFGSMLYSDFSEIKLVISLATYSVVVHAIAKRFPLVIWRQYYWICVLISYMTIMEMLSYFLLGEFLFSYRSPEILGGIFPRVTPVFDEMSHQSFFIMPAAIVAYQQKRGQFFLLLAGVLLTFSVASIILFIPLFLYFNVKYIRLSAANILSLTLVFVFFLLVVFVSYDLIAGKIGSVIQQESLHGFNKPVSSVNILIGFDLIKYFNINNWLFGFGYFSNSEELGMILSESPLYDYYFTIGIFDDEIKSVGIVNLIISFGAVIMSFIAYLLFKGKKYAVDGMLYKLAIFIVAASMLKNSHTVDYFVHLFFIFGLSWCYSGPSNFRQKSSVVR